MAHWHLPQNVNTLGIFVKLISNWWGKKPVFFVSLTCDLLDCMALFLFQVYFFHIFGGWPMENVDPSWS